MVRLKRVHRADAFVQPRMMQGVGFNRFSQPHAFLGHHTMRGVMFNKASLTIFNCIKSHEASTWVLILALLGQAWMHAHAKYVIGGRSLLHVHLSSDFFPSGCRLFGMTPVASFWLPRCFFLTELPDACCFFLIHASSYCGLFRTYSMP